MIQSLLIYNSVGDLVFSDEFGYLPLTVEQQDFSRSLQSMIASGPEGLHSFPLNDLQVHYLKESDYCLISYSNRIDSEEVVTNSIRKIWDAVYSKLSAPECVSSIISDILLDHTMKVSLFGMHGVGKTTISKLLLKQTLPLVHIPTIGVEIRQVPEGFLGQSRGIRIWDIGGQLHFKSVWPRYLKGSQVILIVTDSTLEKVLWSRKMLANISQWSDDANILAIANKQDLPKALTRGRVESILGFETLGLTALDIGSDDHEVLRTRLTNLLGLV